MTTVLELRDVRKTYEVGDNEIVALDHVDLTIEESEIVALVGPSGSGKTTLAQALLRFLDVDAGSYTLGGVDAHALDGDDVRRLVGLCAQDAHPSLAPAGVITTAGTAKERAWPIITSSSSAPGSPG